MTIQHQREDGALLVSLGGGVGVILKGAFATKPLDLRVLHAMGPWSAMTIDAAARQRYAKQLNASRVVTLDTFFLANSEAEEYEKMHGEFKAGK